MEFNMQNQNVSTETTEEAPINELPESQEKRTKKYDKNMK